jgi:hypothetical protein
VIAMTSSSTSTNVALRAAVVVLTLVTAVVHLTLNFLDPVFILNGLGYLTLVAALYLPIPQLMPYQHLVRWVLIGYAALTVILWLAIGLRTPTGYMTTADEVILILLLLLDARSLRS